MNFKICQNNKKIIAVLRDIAESLRIIAGRHCDDAGGIQVKGSIMFIVPADQADQPYEIKPEFTDSEGNPVTAPKNITFESSSTDDSVVSLLPDPGGDPTKGVAHFGGPGQASLNFNVLVKGVVLGALAANFTVVVGDPSKMSGGKVSFGDLTEV